MTEQQQLEEKTSFDGSKVKVLGETYEQGKPEKPENWREKLKNREDMIAYLKAGVR
ncbi:MAG: hypothetical protein JXL20_11090 [Deltaproteobacteria bacterium]|nr:hypothetical protein [Deltaproteobacteria bacterium]